MKYVLFKLLMGLLVTIKNMFFLKNVYNLFKQLIGIRAWVMSGQVPRLTQKEPVGWGNYVGDE